MFVLFKGITDQKCATALPAVRPDGCWFHCSVRRHYSGVDGKTCLRPQLPFDQRNSPTNPITVAIAPPTNIHIALSVGEPVKNREISELTDFVALTPKIISRIPPARIASETTLFIEKSSFDFHNGSAPPPCPPIEGSAIFFPCPWCEGLRGVSQHCFSYL